MQLPEFEDFANPQRRTNNYWITLRFPEHFAFHSLGSAHFEGFDKADQFSLTQICAPWKNVHVCIPMSHPQGTSNHLHATFRQVGALRHDCAIFGKHKSRASEYPINTAVNRTSAFSRIVK